MTGQQKRTIKRIAPALALFVAGEGVFLYREHFRWAWALLVAFSAYALWVELAAVKQGGNSTLSEITWILWAEQPWVMAVAMNVASYVIGALVLAHFGKLVLVVVAVCSVAGFLVGHFIAQASDKYDEIRGGDLP